MNILSTKETGMGGKWVLVKYEENFYAYGTESDLHSLLGFPVNQCGTKEEIIDHCESLAMLCKKNINQYNKKLLKKKGNVEGWKLMIKHEQRELEMLVDFAKILAQQNNV